jgi:hypothetical protein
LGAALCGLSGNSAADIVPDAGSTASAPDARWSLHVLYRPGGQDARVAVGAAEGVIPVRAPWQCNYQRTTLEQQEMVKVKCSHASGAVVGTLAMCRREPGQSDIAQLSIGVDGVAVYETIDLSCFIPDARTRTSEPTSRGTGESERPNDRRR